ncbi:MAG: transcriptional regulator [Rhizobiales bacterium 65-79]|nr:helix-turn-helix transcriptional regulator [Hyphomicrobiales bacterium]OJU01514.1 MAG: transcriptional regulator [Rhizobiales bacterium 65-79]
MSRSIHSEEHLVFRKMLAAARKNAGLTQHEIARRIDRPQSFVAKYEGGERRVDVLEFIMIARALGRDPVHLFAELVAKVQQKMERNV